jgi:choline-sulfatase
VRILYLDIDTLAADGVRLANVYASDMPCLPSRTALITDAFGIRNGVVNHGGAAADLRSLGGAREFVSWWAWLSWASAFYNVGWHTRRGRASPSG